MSMTHFKRTLIHTCTIERRTDSQSESGELIPAWSNVSTATRCRYIQKQEMIASEGLSAEMAQRDLLLLLSDTDIQEEDRVSDIAYLVGDSVLDAGPFTVEARLDRHNGALHHISVNLERIE